MSKAFWIALVVNLCLLIGYEVVYSIQMFDFVWKTVRPSSMSFSWTPFFLSMSFGSTIDTGEGMLYADGWVLIPTTFSSFW